MNIHYKNYPTDYIDHLQAQGKRHKARCFWEYYNDVQNKAVNSIGFYAKSWGADKPMSKGTVHKWIKEFKEEIERFYSAHILLNKEHFESVVNKSANRSVKKPSERQVNGWRTKSEPQSPENREFGETEETPSERQVNKVPNINNIRGGGYDGFYFIYRQLNKYAGNKINAYESFCNVEELNHKELTIAACMYLKDESINKKVGVKKFLEDKIYLNYVNLNIKVYVDDKWLDGEYDANSEEFISGGVKYKLAITDFVRKLNDLEIEIIKRAA